MRRLRAIRHRIGGRSHADRAPRPIDALIASLAARQHGVVSRRQLLERGVGRRAIERRLAQGRLHAVHPGVYAVGHPLLTDDGRCMAALLAAGPGAVLSHRSAAALWGLVPPVDGAVEVTVTRALRSRPGLHVHRGPLEADEVTAVRGIPVTTVPRTLLDLATVVDRHRLERAVNEAEVLRLTKPGALAAFLEGHPRRHGAPALREVLVARGAGVGVTRSELEDRFRRFVVEASLPHPETNTYLVAGGESLEVDCLWRRAGVVVELDGRAFHDTSRAFERDRARDRKLAAAGWQVVRVTWRQLAGERESLAADLRMLLLPKPRP